MNQDFEKVLDRPWGLPPVGRFAGDATALAWFQGAVPGVMHLITVVGEVMHLDVMVPCKPGSAYAMLREVGSKMMWVQPRTASFRPMPEDLKLGWESLVLRVQMAEAADRMQPVGFKGVTSVVAGPAFELEGAKRYRCGGCGMEAAAIVRVMMPGIRGGLMCPTCQQVMEEVVEGGPGAEAAEPVVVDSGRGGPPSCRRCGKMFVSADPAATECLDCTVDSAHRRFSAEP